MVKFPKAFFVVAPALFALCIVGCASSDQGKALSAQYNVQTDEKAKQHYFISLNKLNQNPLFSSVDGALSATSGQHTITVKTHKFSDRKSAESFLLSRRTYLHQAYSTLIAPYFGVVNANAECMKLVDVTGEIQKQADSQSIALAFVADQSGRLMDCYSEKPANTVNYFLKYCYKQQSVFEVKLTNQIGAVKPTVTLECN